MKKAKTPWIMSSQKQMLEDYVRRNGFPRPTHLTDDGVSGAWFDCPGFTTMREEAEAGRVEAIIVKDMSRLGRDYFKVSQIMEILRQKNVRLITLNDGVDSFKGDDDFTSFRNIMNEWYERDISRKIRSSQRLRGSAGVPLSQPLYGYIKDPENPKRWIVDEDAAKVVRYIYKLCIDGVSEYRIADRLEKEQILTPTEYWKSKGIRRSGKKGGSFKDSPYYWCKTTINKILNAREYMGDVVNFKT